MVGERRFVFLKSFWVFVVDDSLKSFTCLNKEELMWDGKFWGFYGVLSSSFLNDYKQHWDSCLECYCLYGHANNHLPWVWNTRYCVYKVCTMPYHQNVYHGNHRRTLGDLGENRNKWRQNGTWIYSNHHDPYILTVNFWLPNQWVCYNEDIEWSGLFGAPPQGGWNTAHQHGWRWALCTRMELCHQYVSSIVCDTWRTYTFVPYCYS